MLMPKQVKKSATKRQICAVGRICQLFVLVDFVELSPSPSYWGGDYKNLYEYDEFGSENSCEYLLAIGWIYAVPKAIRPKIAANLQGTSIAECLTNASAHTWA